MPFWKRKNKENEEKDRENQDPEIPEKRDLRPRGFREEGGWEDPFSFGNLFGDLDKMERVMERFFQNMLEEDPSRSHQRGPKMMGFSFRLDENGQPVVEHFGNVKPRERQIEFTGMREPLTDIMERDKEVVVTAELPGIEKDQVKLEAKNGKVIVRTEGGENQFYKELKLPAGTQEKTADAKMNNGILEITFRRNKQKGGTSSIPVQ